MKLQDLTMSYSSRNPDRKWYQIWKPRWIDHEITINNADIKISEPKEVDGSLEYTLTADSKTIAKEFADKIIDEELKGI